MHVVSVGQSTATIDDSGSLVSFGTLNFGADGPAGGTAASGTSYALKVTTAGIFSGLQTTEGHDVFLYLQTSGPTAGLILGRVGIEASSTPGLDTPDPNGKVAFALAIDPASGEVYIADYLSLRNPLAGSTPAAHDDQITLAPNTVGVVVTLTDGDGDTISTPGTDVSSQIRFQDDGPTAPTVTVSTATAGVDETPGVQTTGGASDVLGSTAINFNGAATTVAGLFGTVADKGIDPDVPGGSLDNGALSFASSGAGSIVTVTGGAFGADGPAASAATTYALSVTNAASGLTLTDGTAITLSLVDGRVIGTAGTDSVNTGLSGKVAFAIALDPVTGEMYVAQYLSLHQDSLATTPNDFVTLAAGSVGVTVTLTDGDGDRVTTAATDISTHISFFDDGPTEIIPAMAVTLNTAGKTITAALDVDTNVDNNYGADGGNVQFAAFLNNVDSGLTSGGQHIFTSVSADGHTLTGYLDTNGSHTFDAGDVPVLTIALNLDNSLNLSNDTYTVNMIGTIDGGAETISFSGIGVNFVGGNDPWAGFKTASGEDLLLTPDDGFLRSGTINMDANAGGVGRGNSMGPGDIMALDFVNNLTGNPTKNVPSNDYSNVDNQDHVFTGHYTRQRCLCDIYLYQWFGSASHGMGRS